MEVLERDVLGRFLKSRFVCAIQRGVKTLGLVEGQHSCIPDRERQRLKYAPKLVSDLGNLSKPGLSGPGRLKTHVVTERGALEKLEQVLARQATPGMRGIPEPVEGRLRRRAVWACRLSDELGLSGRVLGAMIRGRWIPDLTSDRSPGALALAALFKSGVKFLGGGTAQVENVGEEKPVATAFLRLQIDDSSEIVYPELLCRLSTYAFGRNRDKALFTALRLRAQEWAKERMLSCYSIAQALPATVALSTLDFGLHGAAKGYMDNGAVGVSASGPKGWWNTRG